MKISISCMAKRWYPYSQFFSEIMYIASMADENYTGVCFQMHIHKDYASRIRIQAKWTKARKREASLS